MARAIIFISSDENVRILKKDNNQNFHEIFVTMVTIRCRCSDNRNQMVDER